MSASRRILKILKGISAGIALFPAAFTYDNLIGKIWMHEYGYDAESGKIYLSDPSGGVTPQWGGSYDKR